MSRLAGAGPLATLLGLELLATWIELLLQPHTAAALLLLSLSGLLLAWATQPEPVEPPAELPLGEDLHLRRANPALSLLKALTEPEAGSRSASPDDQRPAGGQSVGKPLASPSASSGHSTGYNSDSPAHSQVARPLPAGTPTVRRPPSEPSADQVELEVIELLRGQPSAMRSLLDQLREGRPVRVDRSPVAGSELVGEPPEGCGRSSRAGFERPD